MAIKVIIWDVGGVLERTEDFAPRQALASRLGWDMEDLMDLVFGNQDSHRVQLGQIPYDTHWQNVAKELGIPKSEIPKFRDDFFAGDKLDYDLVEEIRAFKQRYTTAILSNYMPNLRSRVEQLWGIGDAFDHLIVSSEVGVMKPNPAIYRIALEKADCQPGEAVFLDDFIENVEGARRVGLHAVWFKNKTQGLAELHKILENG